MLPLFCELLHQGGFCFATRKLNQRGVELERMLLTAQFCNPLWPEGHAVLSESPGSSTAAPENIPHEYP